MGRKPKLTNKDLRTKYDKWMLNFIKGIKEIQELPAVDQQYLWFIVLQDCLYNTESNVFLAEMYTREDLYTEEDKGILSDVQLAPMNKARLLEGMKTFVMNSGRRKWVETLNKIQTSANKEDY
jgi:hypothetical protein